MRYLPILLALSASLHAAPENLLRNGSFEGGLLYWHDLDESNVLVNDATVGQQSLKIVEENYVISAPVVCEMGEQYTITFDVKAEMEGTISIAFHPSARETATGAKRMWVAESWKAPKGYHFLEPGLRNVSCRRSSERLLATAQRHGSAQCWERKHHIHRGSWLCCPQLISCLRPPRHQGVCRISPHLLPC